MYKQDDKGIGYSKENEEIKMEKVGLRWTKSEEKRSAKIIPERI